MLVLSEIWGVHEYIDSTRRFAKEGFCAVAPELFKREGGVTHMTNIQDILKIVLAVPRKQILGDCAAAIEWAKARPERAGHAVGVTGWCWGGSTTIPGGRHSSRHQGGGGLVRPAGPPLPGHAPTRSTASMS